MTDLPNPSTPTDQTPTADQPETPLGTSNDPDQIPDTNTQVSASVPTTIAADAQNIPDSGEGQFNIETYESTRAIISRQIELLEEIKRKQKIFREQMESLFEGSEAYVAAEKQAKELTKDVKEKRSTIMQSPQAKTVKMHLQDLREEKKELEEALSGHLFDLYQSTGVTEFEGTNGEVYEYKISAKLGAKKMTQ